MDNLMIDELEAAMNKGASLFKAFETGKELVGQFRAIEQAVTQKTKEVEKLDKEIAALTLDKDDVVQAIEQAKKGAASLLTDAKNKAEAKLLEADKAAAEKTQAAQDEFDDLVRMIKEKKKILEDMGAETAKAAAALEKMQKQKADLLAKLAG